MPPSVTAVTWSRTSTVTPSRGSTDDPNEALRQIRELATQGGELGDLVIGLDHWLSSGGFLPMAWSVKR
jgi:hypothetical protein